MYQNIELLVQLYICHLNQSTCSEDSFAEIYHPLCSYMSPILCGWGYYKTSLIVHKDEGSYDTVKNELLKTNAWKPLVIIRTCNKLLHAYKLHQFMCSSLIWDMIV